MALRTHRTSAALALALAACGDAGDLSTGTTGTTGAPPTTDVSASSSGTTGTTGTTDIGGTTEGAPTTTTGTTDEPATTSATTGAGATTGGVDDLPPTEGVALEVWLAEGSYKAWAAESKVHMSTGPHGGNVRTYVNAALFDSLTAKSAMHPQGAATVKELYSDGMDTITGYAVMVKVAPDSAAGEGWYWYERVGGTTYADGTGVGLCSGCHGGGVDYVLTPFPLQ